MGFLKRKRNTIDADGIPGGLWMKCTACQQTVYRAEVEENLHVCPACGYHYRISAPQRINLLMDPGSFEETATNLETTDPLEFRVGEETYRNRIERAREESGLKDALLTGFAAIEGYRIALGAMESSFIMASMGSVLGEKFCRLVADAIHEEVPLVVFAASGGARMQEGILALMQMAKTADAVRELNAARLPYISVLTDPTSGGVLASFAGLGDLIIAEPGAYIGFAGARLIEGALKVKLPEGFQRAEYQFDNGFIDQIVKRTEMRAFLGRALRCLSRKEPVIPPAPEEAPASEAAADTDAT